MSRFKPTAVHVVPVVIAFALVVGMFVFGGRSIESDAAVGGSTIPSTLVRPSTTADPHHRTADDRAGEDGASNDLRRLPDRSQRPLRRSPSRPLRWSPR